MILTESVESYDGINLETLVYYVMSQKLKSLNLFLKSVSFYPVEEMIQV